MPTKKTTKSVKKRSTLKQGNGRKSNKSQKKVGKGAKTKTKPPEISDVTLPSDWLAEGSQGAFGQSEDLLGEEDDKRYQFPQDNDIIQPLGSHNFSESAMAKPKKVLKSAMKPGKEKAIPYSHSQDLADPWAKKSEQEKDDLDGLLEMLGLKEQPSQKRGKRWPTKQGNPTLYTRDFMDEIPKYLKSLGILHLFQRIITNLYMMNPKPKNPCLEIFHLLDQWFGASDKSKAVETLEREYNTLLLKEHRIIQEIGKLKALCHLLLPEEYGPNGTLLRRYVKKTSTEDIVVEYGGESDSDLEQGKQSLYEKGGKKGRKKKEKEKDKKLKKATSHGSSMGTVSSMSTTKKKKKGK